MIVEISVPLLPDSIFLVPDDEAEALRAKAHNPGRMWTYAEVRQLAGMPVEEARKIAEAKMMFKASALWTRPAKKGEKVAEQVGLFE